MACKNNLVLRYRVRVEGTIFEHIPLPKIIKVGGLSLGQYDTETITETTKIISIPTNTRKLPSLILVGLYGFTFDLEAQFNIFKGWFENSPNVFRNVYVDITNKVNIPFYTWTFYKCSLTEFSVDDLEMEANLGKFQVKLDPLDVYLENYFKNYHKKLGDNLIGI